MCETVPRIRIRPVNRGQVRPEAGWVLYWMSAARRPSWNFSLDRAIWWAERLRKPLAVVETFACDERWMNPRHAAFLLGGMEDNAAALAGKQIAYRPLVAAGSAALGRGLAELAGEACLVVADWNPVREAADRLAETAGRIAALVESVDCCGLLPLAATDKAYPTAHAFRRFLQRSLADHLADAPSARPKLPPRIPPCKDFCTRQVKGLLVDRSEQIGLAMAAVNKHCPDRNIQPVEFRGGPLAAQRALRRFLDERLAGYATERNQPEHDVGSGLSPYLHHGHISVHEVFAELARREDWSPDALGDKATGSRQDWWGMSESAESFLDELVTWREVGLNMCAHRLDYDQPDSLPDWARATLDRHAVDRREHAYDFEAFRDGASHDRLWNAAQGQLVAEGRIHNYLRMLWGKKILEWSPSWREALDVMIRLNNQYALDGNDPNSYSGIFWVLGRYDRPWGPERPIFGTVRYMSSDNTARKVRVRNYIERYSGP